MFVGLKIVVSFSVARYFDGLVNSLNIIDFDYSRFDIGVLLHNIL